MVMNLKSLQQASDDAEWEASVDLPGVRWKVRPLDFQDYQVARDGLLKRLQRQYKDAPIPDKAWKPMHGALVAKHLVLGWEGFDEEYSTEKAATMFGDWTWRRVVDDAVAAARRRSEVMGEFLEDAAKNSEPPSATT